MTLSLDASSPSQLNKESPLSMAASSPLVSPSSDKRFWSTLRNRVETLLESRNPDMPTSTASMNDGGSDKAKRLKDDSMLLIRGFDSIAYSLSQLNGTLDNALQGARDLAKPPTLREMIQSSTSDNENLERGKQDEQSQKAERNEGERKGTKKRKVDDARHSSHDQVVTEFTSEKENEQQNHLQKVKNLAVSMTAKSTSLARELKSIKSDLSFMQERCALLVEENRRLRDGFGKGIRPEEDDLVRLQLEALLAEKSRLATENANLSRENQCLRQLVEYHQFATQDLSASYEQAIQGLCLDFLSPPIDDDPQTPSMTGGFEFQACLDEAFAGEEKEPKD